MEYEELNWSEEEDDGYTETYFQEEKLEYVLTTLIQYCQENHLPLLNQPNTVMLFKNKLNLN